MIAIIWAELSQERPGTITKSPTAILLADAAWICGPKTLSIPAMSAIPAIPAKEVGEGLGLGDGLRLGETLGLSDGLRLGERLGLGEGLGVGVA